MSASPDPNDPAFTGCASAVIMLWLFILTAFILFVVARGM